jgi:hypothetical protein
LLGRAVVRIASVGYTTKRKARPQRGRRPASIVLVILTWSIDKPPCWGLCDKDVGSVSTLQTGNLKKKIYIHWVKHFNVAQVRCRSPSIERDKRASRQTTMTRGGMSARGMRPLISDLRSQRLSSAGRRMPRISDGTDTAKCKRNDDTDERQPKLHLEDKGI